MALKHEAEMAEILCDPGRAVRSRVFSNNFHFKETKSQHRTIT